MFASLNKTFANAKALSVAVVLATLVAASNAAAQQIHLRHSASIDSNIIRLGDIAEIVGGTLAEKSSLHKLELFPFNPRNRSISVSQVRDELAVSGIDLLRWRLTGSNTISLTAEKQTTSVSAVNQLRAFPASPSAPTANLPPAQQMVRSAIQQATYQQPVDEQFDIPSASYGVPANPYRTNNSQAGNAFTGMRTGSAANQNETKHYAWSVRADLDRGAVVGEMDLEIIEWDRPIQDLVIEKADILGKVVRNRLVVGQPIRQSSLETLKYVQRGKEVKIVSQIDAISVSTFGRSLADATLGQEVTVESIDRKKKFIGRVTDFQTVTVSQIPNQDTIVAQRRDQPLGANAPRLARTYNQSAGQPSVLSEQVERGRSQSRQSESGVINSDRLPTNSLR